LGAKIEDTSINVYGHICGYMVIRKGDRAENEVEGPSRDDGWNHNRRRRHYGRDPGAIPRSVPSHLLASTSKKLILGDLYEKADCFIYNKTLADDVVQAYNEDFKRCLTRKASKVPAK
jgi:hypothetical protein